MQYFGGKARVGKKIADFINPMIGDKDYYEPFVGGAHVLQHIKAKNRYASDINKYLIAMYKALQAGKIPPGYVSEAQYKKAKEGKYPDAVTGFIGFGCSFAGKWFGGYARRVAGDAEAANFAAIARRSLFSMLPNIESARFECKSYSDILPSNSVVYCDPPYRDTVGYGIVGGKFDHTRFWDWVENQSKDNVVVVSEYTAPEKFVCV